jgi:hypothetical protein
VDAQQFVCWPIAAGDTVSSLARRLTGHASAAYGLSFQIRDPARRMFVPKSHYQRLQSDWQACVASAPVRRTPIAFAPVVELGRPAMTPAIQTIAPPSLALASAPSIARAPRTSSAAPLAGAIGAGVIVILLLSAAAGPLARRPMPPSVRRAGEHFVTVFARPLVDPSSAPSGTAPPIESKLRFLRRTQQLEIALAPGPGHRYPNLADHKNNVEYDIERVLGVLGHFVLSSPPRAAGKWVVVTICPVDRTKQGTT